MKKQLLFLLLCCFPILFYAQPPNLDFENGITGWTNSDGSTSMLTQEMHSDSALVSLGNYFLQKTCNGSNTIEGEMAVVHHGHYNLYDTHWGTGLTIEIKNDNNFPLYIRLGIEGTNEAKLVTVVPKEVPANSDWTFISFWIGGTSDPQDEIQIIDVGNHVDSIGANGALIGILNTTLSNTSKLKIIHSATPTFDGDIATGTLKIDDLDIILLLSVEEKFLNDIKVFPNPVVDQLFINFPTKTKGTLTVMSIDGRKLFTRDINTEQMQLDVSTIKSKGIYFLKIETPQGTLTKKIVKA